MQTESNTTDKRPAALQWWEFELTFEQRGEFVRAKGRTALTGREIQEIWESEVSTTDNKAMALEDIQLKSIEFFPKNELVDSFNNGATEHRRFGFVKGANWQKEQSSIQYKELIDSHAELLGIAKTVAFWFSNEANYPEGTLGYRASQEAKAAIEKANIINPKN